VYEGEVKAKGKDMNVIRTHTEHEASTLARTLGGCYGYVSYAIKGGYWCYCSEKPGWANFTSFGILPTPEVA
jgi:hypothetical protein